MKIIELELTKDYFYCPATGIWITSEDDVNHDAPSLLGYWLDEFWREPFIKNDLLQKAWEDYIANFDALESSPDFVNPFESLQDFFRSLKLNHVVVFKIINDLPTSLTPYFIIDLEMSPIDNS